MVKRRLLHICYVIFDTLAINEALRSSFSILPIIKNLKLINFWIMKFLLNSFNNILELNRIFVTIKFSFFKIIVID